MKDEKLTDEIVSIEGYIKQMAYSMCQGNRENAKDIAQETILKMLKNRDKFKEGTNIKSWAYTIMRNTYITQQNREITYETLTEEHTDNPLEEQEYIFSEIIRCINHLPIELGWVIKLRVQGFSYSFIALEENCTVSTVRGRLYTARKMLRKILEAV